MSTQEAYRLLEYRITQETLELGEDEFKAIVVTNINGDRVYTVRSGNEQIINDMTDWENITLTTDTILVAKIPEN